VEDPEKEPSAAPHQISPALFFIISKFENITSPSVSRLRLHIQITL
jgi:hypothetical protein